MSKVTGPRDRNRASLYHRFVAYLRDCRQVKSFISQPPRNLAEALRDSGALQVPPGRDRFTGGWA